MKLNPRLRGDDTSGHLQLLCFISVLRLKQVMLAEFHTYSDIQKTAL